MLDLTAQKYIKSHWKGFREWDFCGLHPILHPFQILYLIVFPAVFVKSWIAIRLVYFQMLFLENVFVDKVLHHFPMDEKHDGHLVAHLAVTAEKVGSFVAYCRQSSGCWL